MTVTPVSVPVHYTMSERLLFWGSGSIPCWKPMLVLAEKGIDYESKQISFSEKGHKGPEVTTLNPRGQVYTVVYIHVQKFVRQVTTSR